LIERFVTGECERVQKEAARDLGNKDTKLKSLINDLRE